MEKEFDRRGSMRELCEYPGISWDTSFSWIKNKNMPAHKIGRFWKFKFDEIDAWGQGKWDEGGLTNASHRHLRRPATGAGNRRFIYKGIHRSKPD